MSPTPCAADPFSGLFRRRRWKAVSRYRGSFFSANILLILLKHMRKERQVDDRELSRPASILAQRFVQRWDIHARQLDDGRYVCIHKPLNVNHLFAHIRGDITLGTYLLNQESQARFIVFDADDEKNFQHLINLSHLLAEDNIPSYLEESRRGGHLWLFLSHPVAGKKARWFAKAVLTNHHINGVEVFPKQDKLQAGPGSLIRMPFGIHRIAGQRFGFVNFGGEHLTLNIIDQIMLFSAPETIPNISFEQYVTDEPSEINKEPYNRSREIAGSISERIKKNITVLEFVSQYVDLNPTDSGGIGLCPFHDDHQPSFSVNDQENFWYCFAGCGGGSIIDFWIKWRECDFKTAISDLAELLL